MPYAKEPSPLWNSGLVSDEPSSASTGPEVGRVLVHCLELSVALVERSASASATQVDPYPTEESRLHSAVFSHSYYLENRVDTIPGGLQYLFVFVVELRDANTNEIIDVLLIGAFGLLAERQKQIDGHQSNVHFRRTREVLQFANDHLNAVGIIDLDERYRTSLLSSRRFTVEINCSA